MTDDMTLRDALAVVRRRWWVVLGAVVVTAGVALGLSIAQTPIYEAEAQMLVQTRGTDSLFGSDIDLQGSASRDVDNAIQVLEGEQVRVRVEEILDVDSAVPGADGRVVGGTDVIAVIVRSTDPQTAQTVANAYIQAYIDVRREQAVEDILAASAQVQNKITELEAQVEALPEDDPLRASLLGQQAAFRQTLNQLQVDAALKTGGAVLVKSAPVPTDPVEPTPLRSTMTAAAIGLIIGLAAAFAVEYFDDSVRSEQDLARLSSKPVLAAVPIDPPTDHRPVSLSAPSDYAVEIYRGLRTNVQFLSLDQPLKVVQITSSMPGEGKTTTATNLAVVLAQAGRRVVLVDADLRRPRVHEVFGSAQAPGLTDLLVGAPLEAIVQTIDIGDGNELTLLVSGEVPANPSEMLSSHRCRDAIAQLAEHFDYVVIDSAPILPVTDSVALSGAADAVLFVAQARRTSRRNVVESQARLDRVGANVSGFVLNQAKAARSGAYGYGYGITDRGAEHAVPGQAAGSETAAHDEPPAGGQRDGAAVSG